MKKIIGMLILGMLFSVSLKGQTFSELFEQKKTQEKYLLLQLGALKVQSGLLEEAAQIFQSGLGLIGAWKDGEFLAHQDFVERWRKVGPQSEQVVIRMAGDGLLPNQIGERIQYSQNHWQSSELEAEFGEAFFSLHRKLEKRSMRLGEAFALLNSGKLELRDAQRAELLMDLERKLFTLSTDLNRLQLAADTHLKQQEFEEGILKTIDGKINSL
ncbi:hypothetical protein [Algoriphagus sp.]|uniref:hypothetical protein n=1 Tax=Algoriphagus sp. TaxID=1872435 RepID=UPI0026121F8A|nr:hypothetical protein [Algoriphagus sp.]